MLYLVLAAWNCAAVCYDVTISTDCKQETDIILKDLVG